MASRILKSNYPGLVYKANLTAVPADLRYDPTNGNVELVQQGLGGKVLMGLTQNGNLVFTDYGQSVLQFFEPNLPPSTQIMPAEPFGALIINDVKAAAAAVGGKLPSGKDFQRGGTQPAPAATGAAGQPPQRTPDAADPGPNTNESQSQPPTATGLTQFSPDDFGTKESFGNLMYPKTMNTGQDRIFINQVQYKRSDVLQREGDFTKLESVGSVTLPMPNDISETNSVGWGEDSLSNIAAMLMPGLTKAGIAAGSGDVAGAVTNASEALITTLKSNSASTRATQFLATKAAAGIVGKLGITVNAEAFITRSTGAAINPNLELLFNGPKLRQFGFQFKLTPRDGGEAREIRKIIRFFKQGMSPRKGATNDVSFFLGTPNVFKIKFMSGNSELKSIGRIKTCALVSFSANYTPDGFYAAYKDSAAGGSQPVAVTIQLGFTELTPIFNDEYSSDPDTYDDIGPNDFPKADLIPKSTTSTPPPADPNGVRPAGGRPDGTRPSTGGAKTKSDLIGGG